MNTPSAGKQVERTVLYYPTISIPDGDWLRQAILYFDHVASIVPANVYFSGELGDLLVPLTPDVEFLRAEGVFRPIAPESLFIEQDWSVAHKLTDEFGAALRGDRFQQVVRRDANRCFVQMHVDKLSMNSVQVLEELGLTRQAAPSEETRGSDWLLIEERAAMLYMSMLAQYLADLDTDSTVPGTDRVEYQQLVYAAATNEEGFPCIETRLRDLLPVPHPDVPLAEILAFKRQRQTELLRYRSWIDDLQSELGSARAIGDVTDIVARFGETQRREIADLSDALGDARMATVFGSLRTLVKANSPALWGSFGVAAGVAAGIAAVPLSFAAAGVALTGAIEVGSYLVDRRNQRRAEERKSQFAFCYHAQAAGLS